ncbi:MAG: NADH dehydrogenase (quinone) subunit D [Abitibacteriaceae bacterium]|nr:NADH dehydrogenase (quinone) subunit D [Abditibacteriaceae bacterium]MBV9865059.1 NADH dehydrogenase (quinone) subunit D [Abditibacteriaceae bacterium]
MARATRTDKTQPDPTKVFDNVRSDTAPYAAMLGGVSEQAQAGAAGWQFEMQKIDPHPEAPDGSERMIINMGPQHPSTHGVLRLVLELDGETVVKVEPVIGYLHTGMEKTMQSKMYQQSIVVTDRFDYTNSIGNNLVYCLAVEKLLGAEIPPRAQALRVIVAELSRLSAHLVWLGTHALDLGAMTVYFYCFREREMILDMFDMICGARLTASYMRIGGVVADAPPEFFKALDDFLKIMDDRINEYDYLLTQNEIFTRRTKGIGELTQEQIIDLGASGPIMRAAGIEWDIRKANPYSGYENYEFEIPIGANGDVYDRYLVRMEEMHQSVSIIKQALGGLPEGPVKCADRKISLPPREELANSMEAVIHHFKLITEGFHPPKNQEVYVAVESPKGELGCYIASDGGNKPYRCHWRGPSFVNLQALPPMLEGRLLADVVAIIGSIDIVVGEIDK